MATSGDDLLDRSRVRVEALRRTLASHGSALVAFSAGVDSTLVLALAVEVLGAKVLALTAHSPAVPALERAAARDLSARLGVRHLEVETREGEDPGYVENSDQRCFHCKRELYQRCREVAQREGLAVVLDGFNADDRRDHRPGHRAALEAGVRSPLAEAGLTKDEVRGWSRALGLPTWDKPQQACLASRIPYGTPVTPERLAQVERAEAAVRGLGLRSFRVRHHGEVARLEVAEEELAGAFARREALVEALKGAGYRCAALDLEPFRSGRLNELAGRVLPVLE